MIRTGFKPHGIDWKHVRTRLRASESALEEALAENSERIETAYRQRAIRLAKRHAGYEPVSPSLRVLVFWLAQEHYGIELTEVAEVLPFTRCTPVPGSPPEFLGMINLRGELRAVVDLDRLLNLSEEVDSGFGFVLMLRNAGHGNAVREVGLKVDRVEDLLEIRPEDIAPAVQGSYARRLASGRLALLDVDQVRAMVFSREGS